MRLLNIILFLFFIQATIPLTRENRKGNQRSRLKKRKAFSLKFTKLPIGQNKDKKSASFENSFNKNWGKLSTLTRANESKEDLPWARESFKHYRREYSSESIRDTSSTAELAQWKKDFDIDRLKLKKDAIIQKINEGPHQDQTHMMAASEYLFEYKELIYW